MILILAAHIVLGIPYEMVFKEKQLQLYASMKLCVRELNLLTFLLPVTKYLVGGNVSVAWRGKGGEFGMWPLWPQEPLQKAVCSFWQIKAGCLWSLPEGCHTPHFPRRPRAERGGSGPRRLPSGLASRWRPRPGRALSARRGWERRREIPKAPVFASG